jgi:Large polyvalent protein associated domain 39
MSTAAEIRARYPDVFGDMSDLDLVDTMSQEMGMSRAYTAWKLGLPLADYTQNESNSQDFGTDLAIGGAEALRGVAGVANIAAAPFTDQQLITTPDLDEYIRRQQGNMSPNRQRAQSELDQAWEDGGFWNIAGEYASEPAYLAGMGLQSAPGIVGGGAVGMGVRGVARLGAGALSRGLGAAAPYLGEGGIAGGMDYAQMVEQGVDPREAAGYSALAGAGVGALGGVGGAFANRMGVTDVSRALSGARRVDGDVPLSYGRQLGYGALSESGQEGLQSPWEQAMQNLATDQPVTEGLARSAVEGGILGGVMGAGFNAIPRGNRQELDLTQDRDTTRGLVNPAQPFAGVPGGDTAPESPQARRQADLEAAFGAADQNLGLGSGHYDANLGRELTLGELPSEVYDPKLGRNLTHAELITSPSYRDTAATPAATPAAAAAKPSTPDNPTLAALQQRYANNPTWPTKGLLNAKREVIPGFAKHRLPALQVLIGQNPPDIAIARLRAEQEDVNKRNTEYAPHVSRLIDVLIAEQEAKLAAKGQTTNPKADTAGTVPEPVVQAPQPQTASVVPPQNEPLGEFPPPPNLNPDGTIAVDQSQPGTSLADLAARNQPKPKVTSGGEQVDLTQDAAPAATQAEALPTTQAPPAAPTGTDGLIADAAQAEQLPTVKAPPVAATAPQLDPEVAAKATSGAALLPWELEDVIRALAPDVLRTELGPRVEKWVRPVPPLTVAAKQDPAKVAEHEAAVAAREQRLEQLRGAVTEAMSKRRGLGGSAAPVSLDELVNDFVLRDDTGAPVVGPDGKVVGLADVRKNTKYGTWTHQTIKDIDSAVQKALEARGVNFTTREDNAPRDNTGEDVVEVMMSNGVMSNDQSKPIKDSDTVADIEGKPADPWAGEFEADGKESKFSGVGGANTAAGRKISGFMLKEWAKLAGHDVEGDPPKAIEQALAEMRSLPPLARELWTGSTEELLNSKEKDAERNRATLVALFKSLREFKPEELQVGRISTPATRTDTAQTQAMGGKLVVDLYNAARQRLAGAPAHTELTPAEASQFKRASGMTAPDGDRMALLRGIVKDIVEARANVVHHSGPTTAAASPQGDPGAPAGAVPAVAQDGAEPGSPAAGASDGAPAGGVVIGDKDASGVAVRTKKRRVVQQGQAGSTSPAAKLSRKPAAQGSTPEQVKQWLGKPLAKLSAAVRERVRVVATVAEARAALPDETIPDDAAGAYTPDGVWLIADNLPSAQAANEALAHEVVGHLGVEGLLNEADFDDLVAQVGRLAAHDPTVRAALETVRRNYEGLDAVAEAKEVLAHLAERKPNFGLVRELLAKLRMWLARHGFGDLDKATLERLLVTAARQTSQRADPAGLATPAASKAQFSRRGTDDTLPAFKAAQGWLKQEFKSGKTLGEHTTLGWLTMEQIAERYGDQVPALRAINTAIGTMEAMAKKWVGKAEHIDRLWQQLSKAQDKLMSETMIAATLAGYDPDVGKTKGAKTVEEEALDRQWQHLQALDKGAKVPATSVYRAVRQHFESDLAEVKAHLKDLKGKEKTPQVEALIGALEGLSKGSKKPYFPLMRLGGYYTVGRSKELQALHDKRGANDDGLSDIEEKRYEALRKDAKHYVVASHSRLANAERHRDRLIKQGMSAFANTAQERGSKHRSSIVEDMKTFDNAIKDLNLDAGVKKQLEQVYEGLLISSLPEGHVLKKNLRRDGIIGADTDMRRVVATSANSRAYALSRLQHARDVQESLGELRAASADGNMTERNLANEMVRRTNLAYEHYQDSPIITAMTTASYMGMLGASPAFWLINLTQVPLITAPWLAARTNKGFTATLRDLGVAAKQASQMIKWTTDGQWRAEFNLDNPPQGVTADEIRMFRALEDAGQLDFTLAFDLGQVAAGKSGKFWNALRSLNAPTNATELINRGGTALTSYRAKRGQGASHEVAVDFAKQATNTTQINYNPANAARHMQSVFGSRGMAKSMFQFYTYQQGMAYLALSTLKDAAAGDKTARKTMAYMTGTLVAMSGVFGLPFVSTLLSAASMVLTKLGDDDEPVDLEVGIKNLLHDLMPGIDTLLTKGAPGALLGVDLSARTGQGNLMNPLAYARFGAKDTGTDTIQELMFRVFGGASAGTAASVVDGANAIADGDLLKGIEKIGPLKAVKDLAKFAQLQGEGVKTGSGEQALGPDIFHAGNLLAQAMGFSPTKKSLYYEGNAAIQGVKQAVDGVRNKLLSRYAQAFIAGKGFTEVHREIQEFNQRHPERKISWTSMTQSVKQRRTNRQERLSSGVAGGKDNQDFQQYGRFATPG